MEEKNYKDKLRDDAQSGVKQIKEFLAIKKSDALKIKILKAFAQILALSFFILISPLLMLLVFFITVAPG